MTHLLGGSRDQIIDALSQAWVDGQALRTYRHAPNTGSRKSWAAGDATSRAVWLALITLKRRDGLSVGAHCQNLGLLRCAVQRTAVPIPAADQTVGFIRDGKRLVQDFFSRRVSRPDGGGVRDATASSCEGAHRARSKGSPSARTRPRFASSTRKARSTILRTATIAFSTSLRCRLIFGRLTAADYEDAVAADPRIDALREKMICVEDPQFTRDYHDPEKRSIANGLTVEFKDGEKLDEVVVEYPLGHRLRRNEGIPLLEEKF